MRKMIKSRLLKTILCLSVAINWDIQFVTELDQRESRRNHAPKFPVPAHEGRKLSLSVSVWRRKACEMRKHHCDGSQLSEANACCKVGLQDLKFGAVQVISGRRNYWCCCSKLSLRTTARERQRPEERNEHEERRCGMGWLCQEHEQHRSLEDREESDTTAIFGN
jgi:hypothetical protein